MTQRAPRHRAWRALAALTLVTLVTMSAPAHAAPTNRVYVSSEKDNKLYVFNTAGERQGAIDVCKRPRDMDRVGDSELDSAARQSSTWSNRHS